MKMQQSHCSGRTFLQPSSCTIKNNAHRSVIVDDMEALQGVRFQALSLGSSSPDQAIHHLGLSTGRSLAASKYVLKYTSESLPANASLHGRHRSLLSILSLNHPMLSPPFLEIFKRWLVW
jgi:hypothetical protein